MHLVALYAALLALLFVGLSLRTLRLRRLLKIAVGDGGQARMQRAMRLHANFAEYVPLALGLIYLVESSGSTPWLVHGLGSTLLVGRLLHAFGLSQAQEDFRFRVAGIGLTLTTLVVSAFFLLGSFARHWAA